MLGGSCGGLASAVCPAAFSAPAPGSVGTVGGGWALVTSPGGAGGPGRASRGGADSWAGAGAEGGGGGGEAGRACGSGSGALATCEGGSGRGAGAFSISRGLGGGAAGMLAFGGGAAATFGGEAAALGAGGGGAGGATGFPRGAFSSGRSGAMSTMSGSPGLARIGRARGLTRTIDASNRMWRSTEQTIAMASARRAGSAGRESFTVSDYAMVARHVGRPPVPSTASGRPPPRPA
jgi:hypothetical protein